MLMENGLRYSLYGILGALMFLALLSEAISGNIVIVYLSRNSSSNMVEKPKSLSSLKPCLSNQEGISSERF